MPEHCMRGSLRPVLLHLATMTLPHSHLVIRQVTLRVLTLKLYCSTEPALGYSGVGREVGTKRQSDINVTNSTPPEEVGRAPIQPVGHWGSVQGMF